VVDENYQTAFQSKLVPLFCHSPSFNEDFAGFWLLQETVSTFATVFLQDNALAKGQNSASSSDNQELSHYHYNRSR